MKYILHLLLYCLPGVSGRAQKGDTLHVRPADLNIRDLQTGGYSYLIIRQSVLTT
jgi:hypothetical protein